jgi:predicted nucleotidyltransferase
MALNVRRSVGRAKRRASVAATMALASSLGPEAKAFLTRLLETLRHDPRLVAVLAFGSYAANQLDEFSDLDLVLVVEPAHYATLMAEREALAASFGTLLAQFSGEHVGEPRLLICLYDAPLLHVDLKLLRPEDLAERVEEPVVLWEREGRATAALAQGAPEYPSPEAPWLSRRFWTWVHYAASKVGRGELFEALGTLDFLRGRVLGPLGLERAGARPSGVRRVETAAPELAARLRGTVARYEAADCLRALRVCTEVYRWLEPGTSSAEVRVMRYLSELEGRLGQGTLADS